LPELHLGRDRPTHDDGVGVAEPRGAERCDAHRHPREGDAALLPRRHRPRRLHVGLRARALRPVVAPLRRLRRDDAARGRPRLVHRLWCRRRGPGLIDVRPIPNLRFPPRTRRQAMHIFLTGGTGFIGQALVRALRARGWTVDALVREPAGAPARWLAAQGCRLVRGDVTSPDGLREAMAGADAVIHNAGVYEFGAGVAQRARMQQVNLRGTDHVLGAALAAGVPRTVYVSTVLALGDSGPGPADERRRHGGRC